MGRSALILASVWSFVACTEDPPPERLRNAIAEVAEADIRASIVGNDVEILFPLRRHLEGTLGARIEVKLADEEAAEPTTLAEGSISVSQSEPLARHRIVLEGAGEGLERAETALRILDWRVFTDDDDLYGQRSLYSALGRLEVQLRGPTELAETGSSPLRVIVRDPDTFEAIESAEVSAVLAVEEGEEHALFTGTTDARGELFETVAMPEGVASGTIRVTVRHDDAEVWATHAVARRNDDRLYLSTDKTIYKPGQTIELRLLAVEGTARTPLASREVLFEARDGRGNKVFRRRGNTDAFGVAAISVPTDSRVIEGDWRFAAEIEGRRTELTIPVERYNLPRMRIDVTSDREFALPGERVAGRVHAAYMFGEPVIGGSITVEAATGDGTIVGSASGVTDADGSFDFEVVVPESIRSEALEEHGDSLRMTATVVDPAAQRELGQSAVVLAAAPIRINLLAADGSFTTSAENLAYVVVTDPLGRPLAADLELRGATEQSLRAEAAGVAPVRFTPTAEALTITALDGAGRTHTREFDVSGADGAVLRVSSDRATYRAGDLATVRVSASPEIERAFVDVYRGAIGIESAELDLRGGEATIELPITEELGGLLVVDALALAGEEVVRSSRALLVEQDDRLELDLRADRASYMPGSEARIEITATDPSGAPQVTAVGLTVVDEAAFVLGGEPRVRIGQVFGLDPRVLPDSVEIAGRTANDLLATEDPTAREELAGLLFARAGNVASPSFDYNSVAAELPVVTSAVAARAVRDASQLVSEFSEMVGRGSLSAEQARLALTRARLVDPFGLYYRIAMTKGDWDQDILEVTSAGPDEIWDNRDDVHAEVEVWLFGGGRFAEADDFARGGPVPGAAPAPMEPAEGGETATVRSDFRETALVAPTLVTDARGRASVSLRLPHSITTWRASADGSTATGRVGNSVHRFRTFQDFFVDFSMPTDLAVGDVLELPAVVYNYTDTTQSVTVALDDAAWFDILSTSSQVVSLGASEVRAVKFRIEVTGAGEQTLTIRGSGGSIADAIVRGVSVEPAGIPEDETFSGQVSTLARHTVNLPSDVVPGGSYLELSLTPGFASEAVMGLESMVQEPNGCFEQTTATAWPNTLVANYLEVTGQMTPELHETIVGTVTRGYQRLLTFESPTGGFNWWGDTDPGNRILSAIMLWHLKDLEPLIETDPAVRDRTVAWLVAQQAADGSWPSGDALHAGNETLGTSVARTTAFIAWALAHTGWADDAVARAAGYLRSNVPTDQDLYANALAANALVMVDRGGATTNMLLGRLDAMRTDLGDDGTVWHTDEPSWTGAGGDMAAVETTGLVAYGLMRASAYPDDAAGALRFIASNKDAVGTWYNTQATVNALRALSAAASPMGSDATGTLTVLVGGVPVETIAIDRENNDLVRRFDLTRHLRAGATDVELRMAGTGDVSYRLTRRAYRPAAPAAEGPLELALEYDRTSTTVGAPISVIARAHNNDVETRQQVMVRIGRAPGFDPRTEDLDGLVSSRAVSRYEVREDDVTFYLMNMEPGENRELRFRLTPGLVVEATAPESSIYAYYEPTLRAVVAPQRFTVTGAR